MPVVLALHVPLVRRVSSSTNGRKKAIFAMHVCFLSPIFYLRLIWGEFCEQQSKFLF